MILLCTLLVINLSACKLDDPEYVDSLKKDYGLDVFEETFLNTKEGLHDIKNVIDMLENTDIDELSDEEIEEIVEQQERD